MKIHDINFSSPYKTSIFGERFLNDAKGKFEDYSEVNPIFDPQGNISHINLPYTILSEGNCFVFEDSPTESLVSFVCEEQGFKFFWHPDIERSMFTKGGEIITQPTSSTRTLFHEGFPKVYIKTDLDKRHFRFVRRLRRSSVEHSVLISQDIREFCKTLPKSTRYSFLPESLGIVVKNGPYAGSGVLFRETTPVPFVEGKRVLLPCHSLYAHDPFNLQDEPLLVQLVKIHGTGNSLHYFISEIIGPILESWVLLVSERGLLPELHGQNSLVEIDEELRVCRLVHRDFQSTYSDFEIRKNLGLNQFAKHIAGEEKGTTLASQYSCVFDHMIGTYLLSRLTKTFCKYFNVKYQKVANEIKDFHHSILGWNSAVFPKTVHRFGKSSSSQDDNDVCLIDTKNLPEFR